MKVHSSTSVCLVPRLEGVGGMVSFRRKLVAGLRARGVGVVDDLEGEEYDAVLVIGGTRQLGKLWRARQRGVRIIPRPVGGWGDLPEPIRPELVGTCPWSHAGSAARCVQWGRFGHLHSARTWRATRKRGAAAAGGGESDGGV